MRWSYTVGRLLLATAICVAVGYGQDGSSKQATSASSAKSSKAAAVYPKDIDPDSGNRLPPVKREELDDFGKKYYDSLVAQNAARGRPAGIAEGPQAIRMYSPHVGQAMNGINQYLRNEAGLEPRLAELAILVAARAMDAQYEWTAHEPPGLQAGLSQEIIDVVKYRKPVTGMGEKETVIIELGREALEKHKVSPATFARALKLFGKPGLVNLVSLMCHYTATAILINTFDQQLSPGDKPLLPLR